jgi:hypothetical protein
VLLLFLALKASKDYEMKTTVDQKEGDVNIVPGSLFNLLRASQFHNSVSDQMFFEMGETVTHSRHKMQKLARCISQQSVDKYQQAKDSETNSRS